jgi:hypothetical protein
VRHPQQAGNTEAELEVSSEVIVVERFVEPISIPEDNTAHQIYFNKSIIINSTSNKIGVDRITYLRHFLLSN